MFSIWHWAILLLMIGVPVFFAVRSAAKPPPDSAALVGFGGWLLLLAIGQVLSPLRTLADLAKSTESYQQLMTVPNGALVVYGEVALNLAFLALQVIVVISMFRRSQRFKQLFVYQWFAIPVLFVLDTLLIAVVLGVPVNQLLAADVLVASLISFLLTGIWVAYVHKSVRVRNTFDRAGASGQVASGS